MCNVRIRISWFIRILLWLLLRKLYAIFQVGVLWQIYIGTGTLNIQRTYKSPINTNRFHEHCSAKELKLYTAILAYSLSQDSFCSFIYVPIYNIYYLFILLWNPFQRIHPHWKESVYLFCSCAESNSHALKPAIRSELSDACEKHSRCSPPFWTCMFESASFTPITAKKIQSIFVFIVFTVELCVSAVTCACISINCAQFFRCLSERNLIAMRKIKKKKRRMKYSQIQCKKALVAHKSASRGRL